MDQPQEMKEHSARLEAILENAVDAIITIDERGIVESANPATEDVFLYRPEEIIGQNVKMLMPSPYCEEHDTYLANYVRTGSRQVIGIGREVIGRRKDGSTFPLHLAVSEIRVGSRRLFNGIARDISDLKEAERQLARLNEELEGRVKQRTLQLNEAQAELVEKEKLATLGEVAGGIAHEIRNPLNAVKTSAYYLMHAKNPSRAKTREHLDRIDRQVTLIDNVISALSDVAKLPEVKLRPLPILECLEQVIQTASMPPNIKVVQEGPSDLPHVLADDNQIPIAFRNLLRNARDAMPSGGTITVRTSAQEGYVTITVHDEGVGIPPEELHRIMEPLYSTKARGMGLGLAITRAIVERNQGELTVESEVDVGSSFHVTLRTA